MKLDTSRATKHLRHRLTGGRAVKMPTKRTASGFVRWVLWGTGNFKKAVIAAATVVAIASAFFFIPAINRVQQALYEQQLAAYNAQEAKKAQAKAEQVAAAATKAAGTQKPLPLPTGRPGQQSKEAWSPLDPTPTATPSVPATKPVDDAATGFLTAWAAGGTQKSRTTWIAAMRPYATDGMLDNFRSVDPAAMPKDLTVSVVESKVTGGSAVTTAQAGPYGDVELELQQSGGKWLVTSLLPAHTD